MKSIAELIATDPNVAPAFAKLFATPVRTRAERCHICHGTGRMVLANFGGGNRCSHCAGRGYTVVEVAS